MALNNLTTHPRPHITGVWVDQDIGYGNNHSTMRQCIRGLSSSFERWEFFDDPKKFYDFLDDNPKTQIFLVMSGSMAQTIVPQRHEYVNIHSMYIFCSIVENHRCLKDRYSKVKDVMTQEDDLHKTIADNLSELLINIGESQVNADERGLAQNNLNEALRLMRDVLRFPENHGRIQRAKGLLEGLENGPIYNFS